MFYSQSAVIASTLESEFPDHNPLLAPAGTPLRKRQDDLNRLERTLFSRWMQWLTSGWMDGQMRSGFEEVLDVVETELAFDASGPYFCGEELTLIDITFTPVPGTYGGVPGVLQRLQNGRQRRTVAEHRQLVPSHGPTNRHLRQHKIGEYILLIFALAKTLNSHGHLD